MEGGTVTAAFSTAASRWSDDVGLRFGEERWGITALEGCAARLATVLADRGVGHGDRVTTFAPNRVEHIVVLLALARLGAIHAPVNPQWTATELAAVLAHAEPKLVLTTGELLGTALAASTTPVLTLDTDLAEVSHAEPMDADQAARGDPVAIWYTSGTTGRPKGAVWSHANLLYNGTAWAELFGLGPGDAGLKATPLAHNGIGKTVLAPLLAGADVHLLPRVDPTAILSTIADAGITWMVTPPALLRILRARAAELEVHCLPSLRLLALGGSPPELELFAPHPLFPSARIWNAYGASEGHLSACPPDAPLARRASVGHALPGTELRILDAQGCEVAPGEQGAVAARGPGIMQGYWKDPQLTARSFRDGWLVLDDVGWFDDLGYLWFAGRESDVINTGGYKVFAIDVEAVIASVSGVGTVAVVGNSDPILGERPVAYLVAAPGATVDLSEVREACASRLARYKQPAEFYLVDALPVNGLGKVQKHRITRS